MPESASIKHPGEILEKEFLAARSVSQYRVAVDTSVPPRRINEIVHGKRGITADTALRLARYFDNDPLFWMQLQARWDRPRARERLGSRLAEEVRSPGKSATAPSVGRGRAVRRTAKPLSDEPSPTSTANLADHLL